MDNISRYRDNNFRLIFQPTSVFFHVPFRFWLYFPIQIYPHYHLRLPHTFAFRTYFHFARSLSVSGPTSSSRWSPALTRRPACHSSRRSISLAARWSPKISSSVARVLSSCTECASRYGNRTWRVVGMTTDTASRVAKSTGWPIQFCRI